MWFIFAPFVWALQLGIFGGVLYLGYWLYSTGKISAPMAKVMTSVSAEHMPRRSRNPITELRNKIRAVGCEDISIIMAIDLTASNEESGRICNKGRSLHDVSAGVDASQNLYQCAIRSLALALTPFDENKSIPLWGFGDRTTRGERYLEMVPGEVDCSKGPDALLEAYTNKIKTVQLGGPTNFAPVIQAAAAIATETRRFHLLVILCDGAVSRECVYDTRTAIVNASRQAPLSILIVGLGDGPFDEMKHLDEQMSGRTFDNVCFVEYEAVMKSTPPGCTPIDWFTSQALAELPAHYTEVSDRGYFVAHVRRRRY